MNEQTHLFRSYEEIGRMFFYEGVGRNIRCGVQYDGYLDEKDWMHTDTQKVTLGLLMAILRELKGLRKKMDFNHTSHRMDQHRRYLRQFKGQVDSLRRKLEKELFRIEKLIGSKILPSQLTILGGWYLYHEWMSQRVDECHGILRQKRKDLELLKSIRQPNDLLKIPGIGKKRWLKCWTKQKHSGNNSRPRVTEKRKISGCEQQPATFACGVLLTIPTVIFPGILSGESYFWI